jgi:arylsulfatase A-like enzyme
VTGTPSPKDYTLDGRSLVPLLKDATADLGRDAIFWHFPCYLQGYTERHGAFRTTPGGAVRAGEWKLIEYFEDNTLELYNLSNDIGEKKDLAKAEPKKTRELHKLMTDWRKKVQAPVPTIPNPKYDPKAGKIKESKKGNKPKKKS